MSNPTHGQTENEEAFTHAGGRSYWRSLDALAGTDEFKSFLHREFPAHASELSEPTRRGFLKLMGASVALAGAASFPGCRRPDHKIISYTRDPEDVIHGKPLFYATAMPLPGGGAEGLLVETHEGRPTKIEGNPLHPASLGKSNGRAQASILDLYDPDRLLGPSRRDENAQGGRTNADWAGFEAFFDHERDALDTRSGDGLFFLVEKTTSPSRDAVRDRVMRRWPKATWLPYEAIDNEQELAGTAAALGAPHKPRVAFGKTKTILAVDCDFLGGENASLETARGYAQGRRVDEGHAADAEMSRLYAVESAMTPTGGQADHRVRLKPSEIPVFFGAVATEIFRLQSVSGEAANAAAKLAEGFDGLALSAPYGGREPRDWAVEIAKDLVAQRGNAAVVVGPAMHAGVHALACAVNDAIGAVAKKVVGYDKLTGDAAASSLASITTLCDAMRSGDAKTVVVVGANPVYDAPADLGFADLYNGVPLTVHLGVTFDETAAASGWRLNRTHYLEAWGDVETFDGVRSVVQPLIAPIESKKLGVQGGRSDLEFLAGLAGDGGATDGYDIVRGVWARAGAADEKAWRRALHDGVAQGSGLGPGSPRVDEGGVAGAVDRGIRDARRASGSGFEAVFVRSRTVGDGRSANNGWLQELPDAVTKITWGNPVLVSPATYEQMRFGKAKKRIGEQTAPVATLRMDGREVDVAVWPSPGVADGTAVVVLGYGRTISGLVGTGTGAATYAVRASNGMRTAQCTLQKTNKRTPIACTQDHGSMEGRAILREDDVQRWRNFGDEVNDHADAYGRENRIDFGDAARGRKTQGKPGKAAVESHAPANIDIYKGVVQDQGFDFSKGQQWGMSVDLNACIGCGSCVVACQSENNIPVVGPEEVNKGREMHWIRVDRYYAGDGGDNTDMMTMPVACVHCENAPCETVCPVNATAHDEEGLNVMAYNRCVGTRYCSNNCPYKVRRFNFFDYATKRLRGGYAGKATLDSIGLSVANEHMIPPRLRTKADDGAGEVTSMGRNPDVTVRERGVMEKCSYCIQRINEARVESKVQSRRRGVEYKGIPDGVFQTACQQACPTGGIAFGDILQDTEVRRQRDHGRSYALLAYLNTRPRTTYMMRLRNPNPALVDKKRKEQWDESPLHHGDKHGENHENHGKHGQKHDGGRHSDDHHARGSLMSLPVLTGAMA